MIDSETVELLQFKREAEEMVRSLVRADPGEIVRLLEPRPEDYAKVFVPEAVDRAREGFSKLWSTPPRGLGKPDQTEVDAVACTAAQLAEDNALSREFPGGYRQIAHLLVADRIWVRFRLRAPGASLGMAHDGLVKLDDHWAWFPKPWRILGDG